jgi:hypothetical protein
MTNEEVISDEIMTRAREIYEEAQEFNSMTWHGPYRDEIQEVAAYIWRRAYETGYRQGCVDSA